MTEWNDLESIKSYLLLNLGFETTLFVLGPKLALNKSLAVLDYCLCLFVVQDLGVWTLAHGPKCLHQKITPAKKQ